MVWSGYLHYYFLLLLLFLFVSTPSFPCCFHFHDVRVHFHTRSPSRYFQEAKAMTRPERLQIDRDVVLVLVLVEFAIVNDQNRGSCYSKCCGTAQRSHFDYYCVPLRKQMRKILLMLWFGFVATTRQKTSTDCWF